MKLFTTSSDTSTSVLFDAPGPRTRALTRWFNLGAIALLALFMIYVLSVMGAKGQLEAEKWTDLFTAKAWSAYYLPGLVSTLSAAAISVITSIIFGTIFGMARLAQSRLIRWVGTVVVEFFRAVPVLMMMIFFWLFLGKFSAFSPSQLPFIAVVAGLTLYNGSVIAELLRSGVKQLPRGQGEAGLAIGLTPGQTLRSILIPQAMNAMMPALLSQFVVILKDTALGYIISYPELLASARRIGSGDGNVLQTLLLAAIIFIAVNFSLTSLAGWLSTFMSSRTSAPKKKLHHLPGEVDDPNPPTMQMFVLPGYRK